jgi:hypothetical protein
MWSHRCGQADRRVFAVSVADVPREGFIACEFIQSYYRLGASKHN